MEQNLQIMKRFYRIGAQQTSGRGHAEPGMDTMLKVGQKGHNRCVYVRANILVFAFSKKDNPIQSFFMATKINIALLFQCTCGCVHISDYCNVKQSVLANLPPFLLSFSSLCKLQSSCNKSHCVPSSPSFGIKK